jgi:hypothetical protein
VDLNGQHVVHAADILGPVLHTDDHSAAGGIGERNQSLENALRGRQVPLELQGLTLMALE